MPSLLSPLSATDSNPVLVESGALSTTDSHPIILRSTRAPARPLRPKLPPPWRLTPPTGSPAKFVEMRPGTIVGALYEVDERLGAGTMGEVYAARHVKLGKQVAIKVIHGDLCADSAATERFAREARALAQIQHPAIVAVEHVGELADGRAYFVMEFLRGESLADRIRRGYVPTAEALRILDQMARALEAAHAHGVVHRDLKPENTYLVHLPGEEPILKLLDFGLAKLAQGEDERAERTRSGTAVGTPMYMSPEQARASADVDGRADIYALGCVAYKLVLDHQLFDYAKTPPEMFAAHLNAEPPAPRSIWPEVPEPIDQCLLAMLAKDPADRPTLPEVRAYLADARAELETRASTTRPTTTHPATKVVKSARGSARTLLAITALVLAGSFTITSDTAEPPRVTRDEIAVIAPHPVASPPNEPPPVPQAPRLDVSPPIVSPPIVSPPIESPPPLPPKTVRKDHHGAARSTARPPPVSAPPTPVVDTPAVELPSPPSPVPDAPPDKNMTVNPFKKSRS